MEWSGSFSDVQNELARRATHPWYFLLNADEKLVGPVHGLKELIKVAGDRPIAFPFDDPAAPETAFARLWHWPDGWQFVGVCDAMCIQDGKEIGDEQKYLLCPEIRIKHLRPCFRKSSVDRKRAMVAAALKRGGLSARELAHCEVVIRMCNENEVVPHE